MLASSGKAGLPLVFSTYEVLGVGLSPAGAHWGGTTSALGSKAIGLYCCLGRRLELLM